MRDKWIIFWSLVVSSLGIATLLYAMLALEPPLESINGVKEAPDSTIVRMQGTIQGVRYGEPTVISLQQTSTVQATLDDSLANVSLAKGDCVVVQGKKQTYKGNSQISITRLRRC